MTPTTTSAAGTDPAFIPGVPAQLDGSVPPALRGPGRKHAEAAEAAEEPADETGPAEEAKAAADGDDAGDCEAVSGDDAVSDDAAEDAADADSADDDGKPVFRVSDRRGSITADREGITFTLDSETAEFAWDEIGAVEIDTPRFGKRFSVTVYTSTRRWFQSDVEATSRKQLKQWEAELDAVLDARFEAEDANDGADAGASEDAAGDADEAEVASASAEEGDAQESPKTAKGSKASKTAKAAKASEESEESEEEPASADA